MKITEHYNLHKPDQDDFYDVDVLNENMDKIDTVLKETQTAVSNPAEQAPVFTPAETRSSLVSGEKLGTLMGKIAKWLADLKDSAFATIANNCTTTEEGNVLDARQGQVLQGEVDEINSNLAGYSFGETTDGQPGYRKPGADTVIPFKKGAKIGENIIYLGVGTSFNVSAYKGYNKFTVANNFLISNPYGKSEGWVKWASGNRQHSLVAQVWSNPSASYNANTGVLSISCNTYKQNRIGEYNGIDGLSAEVWIANPQVWLIM